VKSKLSTFIQQLINGITLGSVYALISLGYTMVYGIIKLINFAHGDLTTAGTFVAFTLLGMNVQFGLAAVVGLLFGASLAMAFYFCILVPAQRREATQLGQIILTQIGRAHV